MTQLEILTKFATDCFTNGLNRDDIQRYINLTKDLPVTAKVIGCIIDRYSSLNRLTENNYELREFLDSIHYPRYNAGYFPYGLPDYIGSLKDATEEDISMAKAILYPFLLKTYAESYNQLQNYLGSTKKAWAPEIKITYE